MRNKLKVRTNLERVPLTNDYRKETIIRIHVRITILLYHSKIWNNLSVKELVFPACVKFLRGTKRFFQRTSNYRCNVTPLPNDEIVGGRFLFDRERESTSIEHYALSLTCVRRVANLLGTTPAKKFVKETSFVSRWNTFRILCPRYDRNEVSTKRTTPEEFSARKRKTK